MQTPAALAGRIIILSQRQISVTTAAHTEGQYILVVDDIETNRQLLGQQLLRRGYRVASAEGGAQALSMLAEQDFDLVLLDIRMPDMDGLEVLRRIRASHSMLSLPVIMVTAEDQETSIVEALKLGANDYLVKPLRLQVTMARIAAQLSVGRLATIKDEVVRFASHDLKKPLLVMLDIAETLRRERQENGASPADEDELLGLLIQTGQNMQQVISGFLDQEALRQGDDETLSRPLDINQVVGKSLAANLDYAARKGIVLDQELASVLPRIRANEFRLCQVLDNLIGNALKFSPRDTRTVVRTGVDGDEVWVDVRDSGPGLRDEDFPKLFVEHAKLSNKPTGGEASSGVGLAMCKQLIALDGGTIGARNNPDAGTTFWIRLPSC